MIRRRRAWEKNAIERNKKAITISLHCVNLEQSMSRFIELGVKKFIVTYNRPEGHPRRRVATFLACLGCLDDRLLLLLGQRPEKSPPLLLLDFFRGNTIDGGRLKRRASREDTCVDARTSPCNGVLDGSMGVPGTGLLRAL